MINVVPCGLKKKNESDRTKMQREDAKDFCKGLFGHVYRASHLYIICETHTFTFCKGSCMHLKILILVFGNARYHHPYNNPQPKETDNPISCLHGQNNEKAVIEEPYNSEFSEDRFL